MGQAVLHRGGEVIAVGLGPAWSAENDEGPSGEVIGRGTLRMSQSKN